MAANMDAANRRRMEMSPMPSFTNKEGIEGMEHGLKSNLPGFAVFKVNPQAMIGAVAEDEYVSGCNFRNFYSEVLPTPMPKSNEPQHMMTLFRIAMHMYQWQTDSGWSYFHTFSNKAFFDPEWDPTDDMSDEEDEKKKKDKKDKK